MAIGSTGAVSLSTVQTEFGGSNPIGINEYYGVNSDPYKVVPRSGTISLDDFHDTSKRTAELTLKTSYDTNARFGWSVYKGSSYIVAESGQSDSGFGSISRTDGLFSYGPITCIVGEDTSTLSPFSPRYNIVIGTRGGYNSGWTRIDFRYTGNYLTHDQPGAGTIYQKSIYRTGADSFVQMSNTAVNGTYAYGWIYGSGSWTSDETAIFYLLRSAQNTGSTHYCSIRVY